MKPPTALEYINMARELHHIEGEVEIDFLDGEENDGLLDQEVSRSEDGDGECGAYVKAWVWVAREEIQPGYDE